MLFFPIILEAALFSIALSIDAFTASLAYGSKNIKIPFKSTCVITLICTSITAFAILAGSALSSIIPTIFATILAFTILFVMGSLTIKNAILKNPEIADTDASKHISMKEAALLAFALSLDGIAVGIGAALMGINPWLVIIFSLLTNTAAITLGCHTGKKIAKTLPFNTTYLAGAILILLAFTNFL